jgi:hypothetical protein
MLTGILIVLVALVALLAIPATLAFRVDWPQRRSNDVRVVWAFGLVNVRVSESDRDEDGDTIEKKGKARRDRSKAGSGRPLAALRYKPFRQRVFRFVRQLWSAVHKEDVFLDVYLGLGDPADTGQLWAWLGPLAAYLMYVGDARVNLVPDFHAQRFEIDTGGRIRVVPLRIIGLVTGLLVSPAFWGGMRRARGKA